jgi:hypothetical protein
LMLGVEMGRLVFLVEHPNDNPEKHRDDRHDPQYTVVNSRLVDRRWGSRSRSIDLQIGDRSFECWSFSGLTFPDEPRAEAT